MNKHTIPKIVLNLLTTKFWWFFRFEKQETRIMKPKFFMSVILCSTAVNTCYALSTAKLCCDMAYVEGTPCKCYADSSGSCAHCSVSGGGCTDCDSTDWAPTGTAGYESRINALCMLMTGKCNKTTEYRCAAGYYGKSMNGTSGCTRCPSSGGVYGTNTAGENTDIKSCCIPANRTMTDTKGTFTFTDECCYSN